MIEKIRDLNSLVDSLLAHSEEEAASAEEMTSAATEIAESIFRNK
ncbi:MULTISPECIES: hypothetical protein [unclassified Caldicellulosiruptor]|nr:MULTISPECIES: hypothetical protein [unclassified Caldicellulosiruptor]